MNSWIYLAAIGLDSLLFLLVVGLFVVWVMALVQLLNRKDVDGSTKICWVVVLCTLNLLGLVLYGIWGPKPPSDAKPMRRLFEPVKKEETSD